MKAVRIENTDDLVPGHLGIPEPRTVTDTADADDLDLIIVPCVTASPDGERLGHGAGYYDHFLKRTNTPKVCLCFDALLSNDIPMAEFDVYMDFVVTENGIYKSNRTQKKKP
jgi:5-formyltetrahydrofolate cyclo-ligase